VDFGLKNLLNPKSTIRNPQSEEPSTQWWDCDCLMPQRVINAVRLLGIALNSVVGLRPWFPFRFIWFRIDWVRIALNSVVGLRRLRCRREAGSGIRVRIALDSVVGLRRDRSENSVGLKCHESIALKSVVGLRLLYNSPCLPKPCYRVIALKSVVGLRLRKVIFIDLAHGVVNSEYTSNQWWDCDLACKAFSWSIIANNRNRPRISGGIETYVGARER